MKLRQLKLADLLQVQNGFAFKSELFCDTDRGLPLIRIRDLPNSSTEVHYDGPYREEFIVNPGDFLIGMDGDFRCFRWEGPRGLLNQRVCRLQGFVEGVEPDFIYHWIGSKLEAIHSTTAFVTVKHISSKQILNLDIALPALDEQRQIVDILNHAASIRRLREEARAKAREIIPALFLEMFGDPATNPKGWPMKTVGEVISAADYGTSVKCSENPSGTPVLRMGNVAVTGELLLDDLKYAEFDADELAKLRLEAGDILFNRTNSKDLVGKTGLWDGRFGAAAASYFIRVRMKPGEVSPTYFWAFFNGKHMKRRLFETARGAIGQANINTKELKAFPIPVPPIKLQEEFAERVAEVEGISILNDRAATAAEQMAQSLLAKVFGQMA